MRDLIHGTGLRDVGPAETGLRSDPDRQLGSARQATAALTRIRRIVALYIAYRLVVVPIIGVLRISQIWDTAILTQFVNSGVILALLAAAPRLTGRLRTRFQLILAITAIQATTVGAAYGQTANLRDFGSHVFQLLSAYVIFNAGYALAPHLATRFWKRASAYAVCAAVVSFIATATLFGTGQLTRFTVPTDSLLIPASYYLSVSAVVPVFLSLGLIVVSAKRAVIFAAIIAVAAGLLLHRRSSGGRARMLFIVALTVAIASSLWVFDGGTADDSVLLTASQQTQARVEATFQGLSSSDEDALDTASAGRIYEIRAVQQDLDAWTIALGGGAGRETATSPRRVRHFIHFTPLSLVWTYGLLFTISIYAFLLREVLRGWRRSRSVASRSGMVRFLTVFLIAAIVRGLFEYTMFADLLTFLTLGLLYRLNRQGAQDEP